MSTLAEPPPPPKQEAPKKEAMFASRGLGEHLVRGAVGIAALAGAAVLVAAQPWLALALVALALLALRGCPLCWFVGLVETVLAKLQGRRAEGKCVDGACLRRELPR